MIQVLSTRQLDDGVLHYAVQHGLAVDIVPFIKIDYIASEYLNKNIQDKLPAADAVIFTSSNAVETVAAYLPQMQDKKFYCIHGKTKTTLLEYLPNAAIAGEAGTASLLADKIVKGDATNVLFFCGNKRLPTLPEVLKNAGKNLEEIVVYKTILTPQKIIKQYDAYLFFSPSAVESYCSINNDVPGMAFCFSGATCRYLQQKKIKAICAESRAPVELLKKVSNYFMERA